MNTRWCKGPVVITATLFGILSVLTFLYLLFFFFWSVNLGSHLSRLVLSDNRVPLTLTVFGRSTDSLNNPSDTLSARIDFYTSDGDVSGTIERSWAGWELKIDCVVIATGNGFLVFPFLAYTDESEKGHGVDLIHCYNRNNFPTIYESSQLKKDERSSLRRLFTFVRTERWMPQFLGSLHHETVSIRSFEPGTQYSLFVTKKGKLKLVEN